MVRTLGGQQVLPRAAHLIAHQYRIVARGAELDARVVGEGDTRELADELDDAPLVVLGDVSRDPRSKLLAARFDGLAVEHARRAADRRSDHPERRSRAHRIAAARPDLDGAGPARRAGSRAAGFDAPQELVTKPRLADARRGSDDDHTRDGLGDGL